MACLNILDFCHLTAYHSNQNVLKVTTWVKQYSHSPVFRRLAQRASADNFGIEYGFLLNYCELSDH